MTRCYLSYVAWMRLTHAGRRHRDEMSENERAEYDALGIQEGKLFDVDAEEARRAYLAVARP
jgi:hypothetical protein